MFAAFHNQSPLITMLWSSMSCSLTFLKYPLAVLAQTPATYILMYCNALSTTLLLFVASNSGKRYWDWTLPRIKAQIELSSTFVYDYKMSTSGSSAKNSHLTQGGRTTMMPMPVSRITSQCKIKLSHKYCPWINLQLWNFFHSFLQWMGSFFLIITFCSAIHVYTDRFADMGIIAIRLPWLRCEFLTELPLVLIFWS